MSASDSRVYKDKWERMMTAKLFLSFIIIVKYKITIDQQPILNMITFKSIRIHSLPFLRITLPAFPYQTLTTQDVSLLQYEYYFKEMQKSASTQEIIAIYTKYQQRVQDQHHKYIALAFRILSRLYKKSQISENQLIQTFIQSKLQIIAQTGIQAFSTEDLKDFLVFLLHYSNHQHILSYLQRELAVRMLQRFVGLVEGEEQQVLFLPVMLSCLKLVHLYHSSLESKWINCIIHIIRTNEESCVSENLTFAALINSIENIFSTSNQQIKQFVSSIADIILSQPFVSFEENYLINLYTLYLHIQTRLQAHSIPTNNISTLINTIQQHLTNHYQNLSARSLEHLLIELIHHHPHSSFLLSFYSLLFTSINHQGQTTLNPTLLIKYVSLLGNSCQAIIKSRPQYFQERFMKMLYLYFRSASGNNFKIKINIPLANVIKNRTFRHHYNLQIIHFIDHAYEPHFHHKNLPKIMNLFHVIDIHLLFLEHHVFQQEILELGHQINQLISTWFKGNQYQKNQALIQVISLEHLMALFHHKNKPRIHLNMANTSKFFVKLKTEATKTFPQTFDEKYLFYIFIFKMKVLSYNLKSQEIVDLVSSINFSLTSNRETIIKIILALFFHADTMNCQQIIKAVIKNCFDNDAERLENILSEKIFLKIKDSIYVLNYYNTNMIVYFYKTYFPQKFWIFTFKNYYFFRWSLLIQKDKLLAEAFPLLQEPKWADLQLQFIYNILQVYISKRVDAEKSLQLLKELSQLTYRLRPEAQHAFIGTVINFIMKNHLHVSETPAFLPYYQVLMKKLHISPNISAQLLNSQIQAAQNATNHIKHLQKAFLSDDQLNINSSQEYYICFNLLKSLKKDKNKDAIRNLCSKLLSYVCENQDSSKSKALLQELMEHKLYSEKLITGNIYAMFRPLDDPRQMIKMLAKYPHRYSQQFISRNIRHFFANVDQLQGEIVIICMLAQPSPKIHQLLHKIVSTYQGQLPEIFSLAILTKNKRVLQAQFDIKDEEDTINVKRQTLNNIYNNYEELDYYDMEQHCAKQGALKLITTRILQEYFPNKKVFFVEEGTSFFKRKTN